MAFSKNGKKNFLKVPECSTHTNFDGCRPKYVTRVNNRNEKINIIFLPYFAKKLGFLLFFSKYFPKNDFFQKIKIPFLRIAEWSNHSNFEGSRPKYAIRIARTHIHTYRHMKREE